MVSYIVWQIILSAILKISFSTIILSIQPKDICCFIIFMVDCTILWLFLECWILCILSIFCLHARHYTKWMCGERFNFLFTASQKFVCLVDAADVHNTRCRQYLLVAFVRWRLCVYFAGYLLCWIEMKRAVFNWWKHNINSQRVQSICGLAIFNYTMWQSQCKRRIWMLGSAVQHSNWKEQCLQIFPI